MADGESDDLPSKRVCLSPGYDTNPLDNHGTFINTLQTTGVDEGGNFSHFGEFSVSFTNTLDKSRDQNGRESDFQNHSDHEFHGCEDFPNCFSVEDDLDNIDEHHFQPIAGPMGWIKRQIDLGNNPRDVLAYMVPHAQVPPHISNSTLWKIVVDILTEPTRRQKLPNVNTLDDVVNLIKSCHNIVVLTGAGVSVSCGIPDFRSRDGIYAKLSVEYPDLPDPQAMFDITYFHQNPNPFFKFAKEIFPGQFQPSLSHRFIYQLEKCDRLLRNYSQNIDTLEQVAGITRVIQCHGSFNTASCMRCNHQVSSEEIKEDILNQKIPQCTKCIQEDGSSAIIKPDIVFFGESLPSQFYTHLGDDSDKADLLIVIGSSLKVRPVALIPSHISPEVPQILINREPLRHMAFDVELLGDCDVIIAEICRRLGGSWIEILEGFTAPPVKIPPFLELPPELVTSDSLTAEGEENERHQVASPHDDLLTNKSDMVSKQRADPSTRQDTGPLECESSALLDSPQVDRTKENLEKDSRILEERESEEKGREISSVSDVQKEVPSASEQSAQKDHGMPEWELAGNKEQIVDLREGRESEFLPGLMSLQSTPEHLSSEDAAHFIFLPPSRYIFSGAELCNSPLSSPRADISHLIPSDDDSDSESAGSHVGSGVSYGSSGSNLGPGMPSGHSKDFKGAHGLLNDLEGGGYSSGDGSEGYGSGVPSGNDVSTPELKLITGGLYSYSCGSDENTAMSVADILVDDDNLRTLPLQGTSFDLLIGSRDSSSTVKPAEVRHSTSVEKPSCSSEDAHAGPFSSIRFGLSSPPRDSRHENELESSEPDLPLKSSEHKALEGSEGESSSS